MNKKILLALLVLIAAVMTISAISASEVNVTDSYATGLVDDTSDVSVPLENTADSSELSVSSDSNVDNDSSKVSLSSEEVLESEASNTLSTNSNSDDLLSSDNGIAELSASDNSAVGDSDVSSKIDVSKTITSKDVTKYYKGSTQYTATFLDAYGNPLANTNVKITVNGVTYTKKTNANGVASLAINLKPGTYKVVAVNPATGYSLTKTFKILSTISASDISKVYTDGRKFTAKFLKSDGKALAKKTVKFKINGKTYKVKTNSNGVASLSLKTLKKGTYKIISYNTDGLTKTNTVKVVTSSKTSLTAYDYTFLKSDSKTIKVKLLNAFGYAPAKGKVIKFKVNGKTYSKKTNANGIAYLKLPSLKAGVYTVKYSFAKSGYYKASSASSKVAVITSKNPKFTVKSGTTFTEGSTATFKVVVTSGSVPLIKKTITFNLDGKKYTKTTNSNGIASLSFKLAKGKHTVTYSIAKDSQINAKTGSSTITIKEKSVKHAGYWLYGSDMKSVNLKDLSSKGVTDIFLNFKAYELYGKSGVESWISTAKSAGISVHMWVQAFYSQDTKWVNPLKDGKENTAYFTQKINEIKTYSAIKGLSGIHLDYLRYSGADENAAYLNPGGTAAINSFVKQAVSAIKSINSNLKVSCALMPETTSSEMYYGQDYATLSQYMDIVLPMIYKGNYGKDSSWITSTTEWYVKNSKGAAVWVGLQTYNSDKDTTVMSLANLNKDISAAYSGGAPGVILFRYGVSNSANFNSLTTTASKTISVKDVITGATNLQTFYTSHNRLPATVTTGGYEFTLYEFLYVMSKAIYQLGNSNTNAISIMTGVSEPNAPSGATINSQLSLSDYVTVAKNVATFISNNNRAPNYASSSLGNIIFDELADSFSRILAYYGSHSRLPKTVNIVYAQVATGSSSSSISITGSGLNENAGNINKADYLGATTNCQVGNSNIKSVVNSITKGLTSDYDKAKAIFNYVRDTLSYSFYYSTKYGAVGTLNAKKGNCVDHSHLLVAMFRTAGLAARYVHGTCTFTSGSTYGHVWTQVLIDGKWVCADATSSKNSLGKISNWNTKSYSIKGFHKSLSF